jgi:hypothetical protein
MMALTPMSLNSVAVVGAHCDDIAIGAGAVFEVVYEVAKIRIDLTKNKNNLQFTKETWEAMLDCAQSDEVVVKLARDWKN